MTHITPCGLEGPDGTRCRNIAVEYSAGAWRCSIHRASGDTSCSHSLSTNGRCSYCGGHVDG